MKICACSSEVCTHWPSPETSRSSSAVRMPSAQNSPAVRSATGMPTRIGPCAGRAGDRHQSAHALRDLVEARPLVIGAVLAEAGDAAIDEARIDPAQRVVIDAEPRLDVGAEVLDHHVGLLRQPPEHSSPFGSFRLSVIARLLRCRFWKSAPWRGPPGCSPPRILHQRVDLDDIGAPVRQLPHAGRPGAHPGEIEHGKARQGLRGVREGHAELQTNEAGKWNAPLIGQIGHEFNSR